MNAIKETIRVETEGILQVRSPHLHAGDSVDVVVSINPAMVLAAGASAQDWRDFIGCFGPGDYGSSDNDSIDRDLATEYGDNHEPGL